MHKPIFVALITILPVTAFCQKSINGWFINFGAGPSYSLYYNAGGWVRDWGVANTANVTQSRQAWAFSHFGEVEYRFKNPRWSVRLGYSMHHFYPQFKRSGITPNGTYYRIDTREADRYLYLQSTVHYALWQGKNRIEIGTGAYIQQNRRQGIDYYDYIAVDNSPPTPALFIEDYKSTEAGFPFNIDYVRTLNNGNGVGCRFNFNYTQSVQTPEHLAAQVFFKMRLK